MGREMPGALVVESVVAFGRMIDSCMLYLSEPILLYVGLLHELSRTFDVFLLGLLVFLHDFLEDAYPHWLLLSLLLHMPTTHCLFV